MFKIEKKLEEITGAVDFYAEKYQEMMSFKDKAEKKITSMEGRNIYLEKYSKSLEERIVQLEQKDKERNVEIACLEKKENVSLETAIVTIAEKLNLEPKEIEDVRRVGVDKPGDKNPRPQPVIITLRSKKARDQWILQRKTRLTNQSIYGNDNQERIFINEDLTKHTRQLFWSAKNQIKPMFKYVWIQNSKILVRKSESDRKIHVIRCEEDIKALIESAAKAPVTT